MAEDETFILVSLEEQKSKELAQVISNDTSRRILESLGKKESTETEISKNLEIPLSTVHYNLQQLVKAGLVESKEFVYSDKGKPVNIYKVAKKIIVISPAKTFDIKSSLKKIFPLALISAGASLLIHLISQYGKYGFGIKQDIIASETAVVQEKFVSAGINSGVSVPSFPVNSIAVWFFFGSMFVIIVYFLYSIIKKE